MMLTHFCCSRKIDHEFRWLRARFCHNTSCDEKVEIGIGTKVWHFCHICEGAKIGSETVIGQGAFIGRRVKIGNNVKLQNNVSVFEGVDIEDSVFAALALFLQMLLTREHS